jgi:TRAP-type mannitol/chloroaromatic compound transport system permease large subunit
MFLGAFIPGLVLVALYMAFIMIVAVLRPSAVPTVRYDGVYDRAFAAKVFITLVPPLGLIFLVLGSIITGVATVNQAGAIGAAGALIMAGYRLYEGRPRQYWPVILAMVSLGVIAYFATTYHVNIKNLATSQDVFAATVSVIAVGALLFALVWSGLRALRIEDTLRAVMVETAKTTSLVFIILIGAAMLTAAFRAFGGEELVKGFLTGLPGGFWTQFFIVMLVIFVLGFFLDFIEIAVVVVPIVAPILLLDPNANITAVWLGVMVGLNIQTSFLTPPFGFALFYLRGVADKTVKTISMYKGVIPFISLQLLALLIVGLTPQMVNYLPLRLSLTSETAPPPRNPALQACLEEHVFEVYREEKPAISAAIDAAMRIDLSALLETDAKKLSESFDKAAATFDHLAKIEVATAALDKYSQGYRALHTEVRGIQRRVIDDKAYIKQLGIDRRRLPRDAAYDDERERIDNRVAKLKEEMATIEAQIPDNWKAERAEFVKFKKAEAAARNLYRRNADQAYEPVREMINTLAGAEALSAMESELADLRRTIETAEALEAEEAVKAFTQRMRGIAATNDIVQALDDTRRRLRDDSSAQNRERALEKFAAAEQALANTLSWRVAAERTILPELRRYEAAISRTIGVRQQDRLARDEALAIASCLSVPADLTLEF